jgi:carbonic anhydrase
MHLFEAIVDANHRAVAGDVSAGLHPADFADELPVIALTCMDPRLNAFFPNALALPAGEFIWLRNAGNVVTGPLTSTIRSLALACAVKGGREIAIIGHTDCQVCQTTTSQLLDKLKMLGVERSRLPENLNEFFGMFTTERQNVIRACDFARSSPLIGPKIPVHGLVIDIETGKLDWEVNGYDMLLTRSQPQMPKTDFATVGELGSFKDFEIGEMKFPEMKIGEASTKVGEPEIKPVTASQATLQVSSSPGASVRPSKIPLPPPIRPRINVQPGRR